MSDPIDRQAVKEMIKNHRSDFSTEKDYRTARACADAVPSAESERGKGTWTNDASCPFCGFQPWYERDIHTLSFCSNCGADLRGESE